MRTTFPLPFRSLRRARLVLVAAAPVEERRFAASLRFLADGEPLPRGAAPLQGAPWSDVLETHYQYVGETAAPTTLHGAAFDLPEGADAVEVNLVPWRGERRKARDVFSAVLLQQPVPASSGLPHASITVRGGR